MRAKSFADMQCSIARSLEQVGPWWSLLIVRDALMGARRFGQFQRSLGIAKNTLSLRLADLVKDGILAKVPARDGSAHDEYELTEKGRDLAPVLLAIAQWGDRWTPHEDGPSFAIHDRATGAPILPILPRREDGQVIPSSAIELRRDRKEAQQ